MNPTRKSAMHVHRRAIHGFDSANDVSVQLANDVPMATDELWKCKEYTMHDDDQHQHQRGLRILVVDDNEDAATTMSALLELEGHRTCTVHNGLEAVQEATQTPYDAVLLDLGMPIMDGFQAAAALGQLWPAPALIACSGWDDAETRRRTADLGFSMHLRKPVPFQVLKAALRAAIPPMTADRSPSA